MVLRRSFVLVLTLLAIGATACGGGDAPTQVAAGGDPAEVTTTSTIPSSTSTTATSTTAAPTATTVAGSSAVTTTAPLDPDQPSAPSPVDGLDAAQLQAALAAPVAGRDRAAGRPTVDQVTLPDGTRVWRVRVPGSFAARSARVAITVGDRRIGEAVLAPDLAAITAVTTDGTGLTAGRPVTYQWEGGPSVPAGTLVVNR